RAARHIETGRWRNDAVGLELQDGRSDALARDRIRADRAREGDRARLRALFAGRAVRPDAAAATVAELHLQCHQIHAARTRAGRLPPPRTLAANMRLR